MTRSFSSSPARHAFCRGVLLLLGALLLCLPTVSRAAPRHHSSSPEIISGLNGRVRLLVPHGPTDLRIVPAKPTSVPMNMTAVPGTGFQVEGHTRRTYSNAYVTISMTAHNSADTALYRHLPGRWQRLPTSQRFRSGHTLTMSARLYRLVSGARYAVLARHRPARPVRTKPIRPALPHGVPPPVGISPPIHDGH